MINVSIGMKRGIYCITYMKDGYLINTYSGKYDNSNIYSASIFCMNKALLGIRELINSGDNTTDFIIECSNSIFVKWCNKVYSKPQYLNDFIEMMGLLNSLPIRYSIVYNSTPKALSYIKNMNGENKQVLSGLDLSVED